jgi:hypothetical protein
VQIDFFTVVIFPLVGWVFLLFLIFRFISTIPLRRYRLLFPIAIVFVISVIGAVLTLISGGDVLLPSLSYPHDIISILLTYPLPTLAIFTVLPFIETIADWRRQGKEVAAFSICYSIIFFWYFWGSNFSGIKSIFLTASSLMPIDNLSLKVMIVTLYNYAVLVAIAGLVIAVPLILVYNLRRQKGT